MVEIITFKQGDAMKTITKAEWDKIPNDYKRINQSNKQAYILQFISGKGTCSIPVVIK